MNIPFGENQWARFTCASAKTFRPTLFNRVESSHDRASLVYPKVADFPASSPMERNFRRDFLTFCAFFSPRQNWFQGRDTATLHTYAHVSHEDETRSDTVARESIWTFIAQSGNFYTIQFEILFRRLRILLRVQRGKFHVTQLKILLTDCSFLCIKR